MEPKFEITIHKVEVTPYEEARYASKWFPHWLCKMVNRLAKGKLISKYRVSDWKIEEMQDIVCIHDPDFDLEKELIDALNRKDEEK